MQLISRETIESIYEKAADILTTVGVEFEMDSALELFKNNGAKIEEKRVFISSSLLKAALDSLPRVKYIPKNNKRLVAATPFSNAPMIRDDITCEFRRGNIQDAIKMYQLAETCDLYESINPGVSEPEGNDSEDPYIGQIAMMLKYSDKFPNICFRATKTNTKNSDVYTSAKRAIQLIKEIKGDDSTPVMGQGISLNAPLSYDEESLLNLKVLVEELIINCNRTLQDLKLDFDPGLKDKQAESLETKSFLTIGSPAIYRKEQRVTNIFDKKGIEIDGTSSSGIPVDVNISKEIEKRCAAYILPDRSKAQINQLQKYLPSQCKY